MPEALAALHSLLDDVEALLTTIEGMSAFPSPAEEEAREMLRRLKDRLRDEHRRTSTIKGRARLNLVERTYYAPAVQEAHDDLRTGIDSPPGDACLPTCSARGSTSRRSPASYAMRSPPPAGGLFGVI